ncbi:MAG: transposase [Fibrobacteres bacterium]|nr:transposase [Fibrobacterota bacterium]
MARLATPQTNWKLNELLIDAYIESHRGKAPQEIVLDFDATDVQLHGTQEGRFFHGHYSGYCYLPLFVFAGKHPLCAILRPADRGPARGALAVLAGLTHRLRRAWPNVRIVWRADAAYCRDHILRWCEQNKVGYVVGMQPNSVLEKSSVAVRMEAEEVFFQTAQWQKIVRRSGLSSGILEELAARDRQGRTQPVGTQYALCGDEPLGRTAPHLRRDLLRSRRNGESIQGDADRLVRIEAVPRRVPGKLDAPFDVHPGICPAAHLACDRIEG